MVIVILSLCYFFRFCYSVETKFEGVNWIVYGTFVLLLSLNSSLNIPIQKSTSNQWESSDSEVSEGELEKQRRMLLQQLQENA